MMTDDSTTLTLVYEASTGESQIASEARSRHARLYRDRMEMTYHIHVSGHSRWEGEGESEWWDEGTPQTIDGAVSRCARIAGRRDDPMEQWHANRRTIESWREKEQTMIYLLAAPRGPQERMTHVGPPRESRDYYETLDRARIRARHVQDDISPLYIYQVPATWIDPQGTRDTTQLIPGYEDHWECCDQVR